MSRRLALVLAACALTFALGRRAGAQDAVDVLVGGVEISGSYTEIEVRRTVTAHVPEVRTCWAASPTDDRVRVRFTVDDDGTVRDASASDDDAATAAFVRCVVEHVRAWRFTRPPSGAVEITMPLRVRTRAYGICGGPDAQCGRVGRRSGPVPRVAVAIRAHHGGLARAALVEVVRRHRNELRFCYEQELARRELAGRLELDLAIAPTGAVTAATLASSTLGDARVEQCSIQAARRWTFPTHAGDRTADVRLRVDLSFEDD